MTRKNNHPRTHTKLKPLTLDPAEFTKREGDKGEPSLEKVAQSFIDREERFKNALGMMMGTGRSILIQKRQLRGTANIERQGLQGIITRISEDKLERVKRHAESQVLRKMLADRGASTADLNKFAPESELVSVEDDLLDIANYCYIAIAMMRGVW